jgi:hypothetical protein
LSPAHSHDFCNIEVEHAPVVDTAEEDFSMEAIEAEDFEDGESSIEVKPRGGGLSEG